MEHNFTKRQAYAYNGGGSWYILDKATYLGKNLLEYNEVGHDEAKANANLFVDALNVANKTGMTPSQMESRIQALEKETKVLNNLLKNVIGV